MHYQRFLIPNLDTHLPGLSSLCFSHSVFMDANRKWRNHSSFSRPVRPKRYRVVGSSWMFLKEFCGVEGSVPCSLPRLFSRIPVPSPWEFDASASWMQMGYFGFQILFRANTDGSRNTFGEHWARLFMKKTSIDWTMLSEPSFRIYRIMFNSINNIWGSFLSKSPSSKIGFSPYLFVCCKTSWTNQVTLLNVKIKHALTYSGRQVLDLVFGDANDEALSGFLMSALIKLKTRCQSPHHIIWYRHLYLFQFKLCIFGSCGLFYVILDCLIFGFM